MHLELNDVTAYDYELGRRLRGIQAVEVLIDRRSKDLRLLGDPHYLRYADIDEETTVAARAWLETELRELRRLRREDALPS